MGKSENAISTQGSVVLVQGVLSRVIQLGKDAWLEFIHTYRMMVWTLFLYKKFLLFELWSDREGSTENTIFHWLAPDIAVTAKAG